MGATASVYMAAVMEYMCAEILELAGNASKVFFRVHTSHLTSSLYRT